MSKHRQSTQGIRPSNLESYIETIVSQDEILSQILEAIERFSQFQPEATKEAVRLFCAEVCISQAHFYHVAAVWGEVP